MRTLLAAIFLLFSAYWLCATEADSYSAAMKMATNLNKPILLEFWRDN